MQRASLFKEGVMKKDMSFVLTVIILKIICEKTVISFLTIYEFFAW